MLGYVRYLKYVLITNEEAVGLSGVPAWGPYST